MAINANEAPGKAFKRPDPLDPGTYPARLVQVLLLGTQEQREFKGEAKDPKQEIMLTYEFLDEFLKDEEGEYLLDKPRWLSETIPFNNLRADLAKSTKRYLALDPKKDHDGDWEKLLGTPCMVTISVVPSKKDKNVLYENISNVSTMRAKEAEKAPKLVNPTKVFNFYDPDITVFNALPEWLRNKMKAAVDFRGSKLQELLDGAPAAPKDSLEDDRAFLAESEETDEEEEENW